MVQKLLVIHVVISKIPCFVLPTKGLVFWTNQIKPHFQNCLLCFIVCLGHYSLRILVAKPLGCFHLHNDRSWLLSTGLDLEQSKLNRIIGGPDAQLHKAVVFLLGVWRKILKIRYFEIESGGTFCNCKIHTVTLISHEC